MLILPSICVGLAFSSPVIAQLGGPVEKGDIVYGLSQGMASRSMLLVRECGLSGSWDQQNFLQSVTFDNAGGLRSNARGNLLALNFGTIAGGGGLFSLATDGTATTQFVYSFGAPETTRVSGISVSPDNTRIAVFGTDLGAVIILDYDAGPAVGSGTGASASLAETIIGAGPVGTTQGTEWLDNDTVLLYARTAEASEQTTQIVRIDLSGPEPVLSTPISITMPVPTSGSQFLDIAYNPVVSPYIFCMYSRFSGGSTNVLSVVDPATWQLVGQFDYSLSMNTAREIALGPDGMLYVGEYGGSDSPGPWINAIDITDIGAILGNDSLQCWKAEDAGGPIQSNFNGIAVAVEESRDEPGTPGDLNGDGVVDFADLLILLTAWGSCDQPANCPEDLNNDGFVDFTDLLILLSNWG